MPYSSPHYSICSITDPEDIVLISGLSMFIHNYGRKSSIYKKREQQWKTLPDLKFDADKGALNSFKSHLTYSFGGFT